MIQTVRNYSWRVATTCGEWAPERTSEPQAVSREIICQAKNRRVMPIGANSFNATTSLPHTYVADFRGHFD